MKYLLILLLCLPFCGFGQDNNYISNKDYSEFVTYVRDSLVRYTMSEEIDESAYSLRDDNWKFIGINWKSKLDLNWPESREALEPWYYERDERLNRQREFDTRKFIHNGVKVYPDVMIWCRDSSINKSWGTFLSKYYYTHPYFQSYPVQGISEQQLNEYIKWKYPHQKKNIKLSSIYELDLTLPKEKLQFTVGEYFEFYQYTRDSIVRMILGREIDEHKYLTTVNKYSEYVNPPIAKWKYKIKWNDTLISQVLKEHGILTSENKIDNRRVMYLYSWLDYYKAITFPDSIKRSLYLPRMAINVGVNEYIKEFTSIKIKKELKNKTEAIYSKINEGQIRVFYYWKKNGYPKKDVFDGFIPYGNHIFWEVDPENFMKDNDMELLRTGKLTDAFYNFKLTIPAITVE